jgi:hypothetical protein
MLVRTRLNPEFDFQNQNWILLKTRPGIGFLVPLCVELELKQS